MKKLLSIILAVVLLVSVTPLGTFTLTANAETEYQSSYYTYTISNGEAIITDVDESISGSITIPSTLGGYPVTCVGTFAFGYTRLTSITIPDSVTSIGDYAFYNCTALTSVTIPDSVTSIGSFAFSGCSGLTSVNIPNSVTSINYGAFSGCTGLTSVTIPDSITSIGACAFGSCTGLTEINVDADNNNYCTIDGVLLSKDATILVQYPAGKSVDSYSIPNSVTSIGNSAFNSCDSLVSVTIPNSVISIGSYAFENCYELTSITIPDSITSIGVCAFYDCTGLTSVTIPDSITSIGACAFYNTAYYNNANNWSNDVLYIDNCLIDTDMLTLSGSFTIPNSVTCIGDEAFLGCAELTSVTIPNSVTCIGDSMFTYCAELTSVTIPDSITSIGNEAFWGCAKLTSITIPDSVTSIGNYAFVGCGNLTIYGVSGSYAQQYADEYGIPFISTNTSTTLFPDTNESGWYYDAVKYVVEAGIMKGYANGYFGTADGIQRQDFLVMLARFDGADLDEYSSGSKFGDVSSGSYFEAAVNWGYENEIVTGYQNGKFGVGDMINREQLVTFLYRYAKYKGLNTDVSAQSAQAIMAKYADFKNVSGYAQDAVLWAIDRGVISGKNGNQIAPFAGAQRCEVAQIMYNINNNKIF